MHCLIERPRAVTGVMLDTLSGQTIERARLEYYAAVDKLPTRAFLDTTYRRQMRLQADAAVQAYYRYAADWLQFPS